MVSKHNEVRVGSYVGGSDVVSELGSEGHRKTWVTPTPSFRVELRKRGDSKKECK